MSGTDTRKPSAAGRSPLRHPAIRRVLVSDVVSRLGSRVSMLALPWFVLVTTGSVARMGIVYAAELLPIAVLGIPSGLLIARIGVRRTVVGCNVVQAVLLASLPLLHAAKALPFWVLVLVVTLTGTAATPEFAAQRLMLPEILGDDEAAVTAANGLIETSTWGTQFLGPALAGILIASLGAVNALWFDAASFAFAAVVLYGLPRPQADLSQAARGSGGMFAGAAYALKDGTLARLILSAVGYGLLVPCILIALPVLADQDFAHSPQVAGWLLSAWGVGALVGTFCISPMLKKVTTLKLGAAAAVGLAVPLWGLQLGHSLVLLASLLAVSGFFIPLLNAPAISILTTRPPAELRAQVITFFVTSNLLVGPVAYLLAGDLVPVIGVSGLFLAAAAVSTVCALILLTFLRAPAAGPDRSVDPSAESAPTVA